MKNQPLRRKIRGITTVFFLLTFPAYFYYLSPMIPIAGSLEGIITGSLVVFVLLFIISLFLGRGFCSYVCPAGTLQDLVGTVRTKSFPRRGAGWIKYVIWAVWLGVLFFFFRRAGGFKGIVFAFQTRNGLSVTDAGSLIVYLMVVLLFFLMALILGRRAACHSICWIAPFMVLGRRLGLLFGLPSLKVNSTVDECIECGRCSSLCPMSLDVQKFQQKGSIKSADCILCGNCIDGCPKNILSFSWK